MAKRTSQRDKSTAHVHNSQPRKRMLDPYAEYKGYPEPSVCPACKLIYQKKHWHQDESAAKLLIKNKKAVLHRCPSCRKIADKYPLGVVNISGDFVKEHFNDLVNLVKAEEKRALQRNPLERLMKMKKVNGGIYIETTSDVLATRLGKALYRSFKGNTEYNLKSGNKYVEVNWQRNA